MEIPSIFPSWSQTCDPYVKWEAQILQTEFFTESLGSLHLMQGLVVNQWSKIFEMELDKTYDDKFEIFGETAKILSKRK